LKNFLIAFEATEELTEGLALALGLGAVQRGGNIRLRHLSPADTARLAHQGYGRLKPDDLRWADCLVVGVEAAEPNGDLDDLLRLVREVGPELAGKRALVFSPRGDESVAAVYLREGLATAGLLVLANEFCGEDLTPESLTLVGNRLAELH
jgi:hypothetical protein